MIQKHKNSNYIFYSLIAFVILFGVLGITLYLNISKTMIRQTKEYGMNVASMAATDISAEDFTSIESTDSEEYMRVYEILKRYNNYDLILYTYALKPCDDHLEFVVDVDPVAPAAIGEYHKLTSDIRPVLSGQACCDSRVSNDRWGNYYSSYAPIFDSDKNVVGIVGCDIDIKDINAYTKKVQISIIIIIGVIALLTLIIYILISKQIADRDALTGIGNIELLQKKTLLLYRTGKLSGYSGILFNIKDFKYVNKKIGASKGDQVLIAYAHELKSRLKRGELVVRTGNDNFFALITRGREKDFLHGLNGIEISVPKLDEKITVYFRAGIYEISEEDDCREILNRCSVALRGTREKDASDIVWFENSLYEKLSHNKQVLGSFKKALLNNEFAVFYQPKVNIKTNKLCGAEALVRWFKDGQIVPPDSFIPALEESGDIVKLDMYVFERVCQNISEWKSQGLTPIRISSNFSKLHLRNSDFAEQIIDIADRYEVDHSLLDIELTESTGYSDSEALISFVEKMHSENISVSMDDFGTGYSSLSMLQDIDCNVIKIDKSFFYKLDSSDSKRGLMLKNVIHMISDLKKKVICEGVETTEQLSFLRTTDCEVVQGYYFDKPLSQSDFIKRLRNPIY